MRSKEQAHDYRYFPDPDLVPMEPVAGFVERMAATIPELPWKRFERFTIEYGINPTQASQLVANGELAAYFERLVELTKRPQQATNFVLGDLSRLANESGVPIAQSKVLPELLAELIALLEAKTINSKIAKDLLERMWSGGGSPAGLVESLGLAQTSDLATIAKFVDDAIAANPKVVADYRAGKTNVAGFLVGQIMKASSGKADPALVKDLLLKKLA
jgi:aspartyl-tRNA(Asn)/glutamyl-tRNA(Gln) amidotransferase subunit B